MNTLAISSALAALEPETFDARVHLGVSTARPVVSLERRAKNSLAFEVPDNAGTKVSGALIDPEGALVVESRLPLGALAQAFAKCGVPVQESDDAGTYLCNQLMYLSLTRPGVSGFIHIPPDETLAGLLGWETASVPFDRLRAGLVEALRVLGYLARYRPAVHRPTP